MSNSKHTDISTYPDISSAIRIFSTVYREIRIIADRGATLPAKLQYPVFILDGGEEVKSIDQASKIWHWLTTGAATRATLVVCIGGGAVTDMAGFAASTYKRGVPTAIIPSTLLAAADAAIGGKTGIDLDGLKNQVGTFHQPEYVAIIPSLFTTLPPREILSGYGEMLKTALLDSAEAAAKMISIGQDILSEKEKLFTLIESCARFKQKICDEDFREQGMRKILNLGHTLGHALESFLRLHQRPISHGHAVIIGLLGEGIISHLRGALQSYYLNDIAGIIKNNYPYVSFSCQDYSEIIALMRQDKKNASPDAINMTLLDMPGSYRPDCIVTPEEITTSLDILRDYIS